MIKITLCFQRYDQTVHLRVPRGIRVHYLPRWLGSWIEILLTHDGDDDWILPSYILEDRHIYFAEWARF